jgi:hypothetical protein
MSSLGRTYVRRGRRDRGEGGPVIWAKTTRQGSHFEKQKARRRRARTIGKISKRRNRQ